MRYLNWSDEHSLWWPHRSDEHSRWWQPQADTMISSDVILADRQRMWGNATIRGTRVPLFRVRELYEAGYSIDQIGKEIYPHLGPDRVMAALREVGYDFSDTDKTFIPIWDQNWLWQHSEMISETQMHSTIKL